MINGLLLVFLGALWGVSFLFVRVAVPNVGPIPLMFLRVLLAGISLAPILFFKNGFAIWRKDWRRIMVVGVSITALPFSLLAWTSLSLPAGITSVLNATTPLMAALWAVILIGERLNFQRIIGLSLGLIGVVLLAMGQGRSFSGTSLLPLLAGLSATCCYGWALHRSRQWLSHIPPTILTVTSLLSSGMFMAPFAILTWPTQSISLQSWMMVLALALPCTSLAYIIFYHLNAKWGTTKTATVTYLIPLFAMLGANQFLAEKITLTMLLGGLIILAGVALLSYRRRRK